MSLVNISRFSLVFRVLIARLIGYLSIERQGIRSENNKERILFVANSCLPTLQLSFDKPLQSLISGGQVITELLSEMQLRMLFGQRIFNEKSLRWVIRRIQSFGPSVIIFCRYSGPFVEQIIQAAKDAGVPTIFHIDDDLLNVPAEIGSEKYKYHNDPARLNAVRYLIEHVDIIYCSTEALKQRLVSYGVKVPIQAGKVYCSGQVIVPAIDQPVKKIGYMGFDHAYDFEIALPVIIQILRRHPHIEFELFGSIPKPASLKEFGDRARVIQPVSRYDKFMVKFASLGWDIGICPLASTSFNAVKANTKWVEYTSVGAAVIASAGTIYDVCCDDGCGLLASTAEEWFSSIDSLICDSNLRFQMVSKAQHRLEQDYSVNSLCNQVLNILKSAHNAARYEECHNEGRHNSNSKRLTTNRPAVEWQGFEQSDE